MTDVATEQAIHSKEITMAVNGQARSAAVETRLLLAQNSSPIALTP